MEHARVADEFRREYPDSAVPKNSTITRITDFGNVVQFQIGRDPGDRPL
jgi:hypothetical protein